MAAHSQHYVLFMYDVGFVFIQPVTTDFRALQLFSHLLVAVVHPCPVVYSFWMILWHLLWVLGFYRFDLGTWLVVLRCPVLALSGL